MEIITSLDLIIIAKITEDLTRKWSIHELAGAIGKHYRPTYLAVQRLLSKITLQKNSNGLVEPVIKDTSLYELAEKKRLDEHKNKTIRIIKSKLENIEHSFFSVILFGSSVYKKGHDIDLLVIIPDHDDIDLFRKECTKSLGSFHADLNIVNERSCYEMLNKPNALNVMNEIMKNHLTIIGIENFYRILRRWKNAK